VAGRLRRHPADPAGVGYQSCSMARFVRVSDWMVGATDRDLSRRSGHHPTQPLGAASINDRFGEMRPLVRTATMGAQRTLFQHLLHVGFHPKRSKAHYVIVIPGSFLKACHHNRGVIMFWPVVSFALKVDSTGMSANVPAA
jgi:hypothetical protein